MSFLAPLYLLAALAIGLPIAFHMIRRSPKGRHVFSSVMFLSPDPPRVTKRSRIEDWLLLLLRSAAILLLALAFARPFLRSHDTLAASVQGGRQIILLIDRSASLQREKCWDEVQAEAQKVIRRLRHDDTFSMVAFDATSQQLITFAEWDELPVEARMELALTKLKAIHPGWASTDLGSALVMASQRLNEGRDQGSQNKELILISDMQTGGNWEVLNNHHWPPNVAVQVIEVRPVDSTNASMQLAASAPLDDPETVRVLVTNAKDSIGNTFQLSWRDKIQQTPVSNETEGESGAAKEGATAQTFSLQAGQSRVVSLKKPQADEIGRALVLSGDAATFDNTLYLIGTEKRQWRIGYLGDDGAQSKDGLRFYLEAAFPDDATRHIEIVDWKEDNTLLTTPDEPITLLVVAGNVNESQADSIRSWLAAGHSVLFVARDSVQSSAVYPILGAPPAEVAQRQPETYALLQNIDFKHSVFKPFDDPRFSDFSRLKIWKYQKFPVDSLPDAHVLASYDDGSPAFAEIPMGQGKLFLLTTGWARNESDFAVSTKFVPMMNALLESVAPIESTRLQKLVGDEVELLDLNAAGTTVYVKRNDEIIVLENQTKFTFDRPGHFYFANSRENLQPELATAAAVNIPPSESRTTAITRDALQSSGINLSQVKLEAAAAIPLSPEAQRQAKNFELEKQQQWWRWAIIVVLAVLFIESLIAALRPHPPAPVVG
ncbi:BatA domain-containing protein [Planctomicrobium sp. SH527]|uniref:BatA domain-containing protein n=1 Tax=Planctomicrobium sp. SH527 TaxID=3448123 RepID=UPI003F5B8662